MVWGGSGRERLLLSLPSSARCGVCFCISVTLAQYVLISKFSAGGVSMYDRGHTQVLLLGVAAVAAVLSTTVSERGEVAM